ncbi:MAG: hypothetical protein OXN84_00080 [Albidovulum sp.]|nr:hypothetical protein [Albidovulum sp.]
MKKIFSRASIAAAAIGASIVLGLAACEGNKGVYSSIMNGLSKPASASGDGGESAGIRAGAESDEESATQVPRDGTYDNVRAGAHLVLNYDPALSAFTGSVTNTTDAILSRVRVEVHLSTGVELGPTAPKNLLPGQSISVTLDAPGQNFAWWSAHPEVGGGSATGEHQSGSESSGEHGGGREGSHERGGEHGGGGEGAHERGS